MADSEKVVTLDGKPISDLRVVDLKKELDKRKLSKSGSKKELTERLKTHLNLERLREKSLQEGDQAPSLQVKDVATNDFVKQYIAQRDKMFEINMQEKKKVVEEQRKRESASEDEGVSPKKKGVESASEDEPNIESQGKVSMSEAGESPDVHTTPPEPVTKSGRKLTRRSLRELAPTTPTEPRSTRRRSSGLDKQEADKPEENLTLHDDQLEKMGGDQKTPTKSAKEDIVNKPESEKTEGVKEISENINEKKETSQIEKDSDNKVDSKTEQEALKVDSDKVMEKEGNDKVQEKEKKLIVEDDRKKQITESKKSEKCDVIPILEKMQMEESSLKKPELKSPSSKKDAPKRRYSSSSSSASSSNGSSSDSSDDESHKNTSKSSSTIQLKESKEPTDEEKPEPSSVTSKQLQEVEKKSESPTKQQSGNDKDGENLQAGEQHQRQEEATPMISEPTQPVSKQSPQEQSGKAIPLDTDHTSDDNTSSQKVADPEEMPPAPLESQKNDPPSPGKLNVEKKNDEEDEKGNEVSMDVDVVADEKQPQVPDISPQKPSPPGDKPTSPPGDKPTSPPENKPTSPPGDKPTRPPGDKPTSSPDDKPSPPGDKPTSPPGDKEPPAKKVRRSGSLSRSRSRSRGRSSRSSSGSRSSSSSSRSSSRSSSSRSRSRSRSPSVTRTKDKDESFPGKDDSLSAREESFHTAREDMSIDLGVDTRDTASDSGKVNPKDDNSGEGRDDSEFPGETEGKSMRPPRVRKRKWGSTRTTSKKSSISISTDSLKEIIDIKPSVIAIEPVLELSISPAMTSDLPDLQEEKQPKKKKVPTATLR